MISCCNKDNLGISKKFILQLMISYYSIDTLHISKRPYSYYYMIFTYIEILKYHFDISEDT